MKCVILAAGIGKRLRPLTSDTPKCLLNIGGTPLLSSTIEHLLHNEISDIVIVTGFKAEKVRRFVRKKFPRIAVTFVDNKKYASTNNAFSLLRAREFVQNHPLLLLDGDILFSRKLLKAFLKASRKPNRVAVRVQGSHDREEIRVRINRWDHILEIGKHVPLEQTYGESIGIEIFSAAAAAQLFGILEQRMKTPRGRNEFYEASFQQFIDRGNRLWAVDIGNEPAAEIDTPEDLTHAERVTLPLLRHA